MPRPAVKSMEIQAKVENSGSESSWPSRILPVGPSPTTRRNTSVATMIAVNIQPKWTTTHSRMAPPVSARFFGRDDRPRQHGDGGSERYGEDRLVGLGLRVGVFDVDAWDQGWVDGALTAGGLRQGGAGSPGHRGLGFAAPGAFLVGALGGPLRAGSGFFHTPLCGCLFGWQAAGLSGTVGSFLTLARRNVK